MNRVKPAWQHAKAGYEYTHFLMNLEDYPEDCSFPTNTRKNPVELDEKLLLKKKQVLLLFSNTMVHCKTQAKQMHGYKLHIMTHAPYPEDKSSLPNGVYILKTYMELRDGSRNVSVVLRNLTSKTNSSRPQQMRGPDSCGQRGARSRALTGAGQGKEAPQAYHQRVTETPYGVAMTGWLAGTAQGVAVGTGPEI